MGKRGPKLKPNLVKIAEGNPGKRPINELEPTLDVEVSDCPDHLDEEARKEWLWISERLEKAGLIAEIDKTQLAVYCKAYSRWAKAELNIQKEGLIITSPNGYPIQNPWLSIANKAMEQLSKSLVQFGMSPSSRANLKVDPKHRKEVDPYEAFKERQAKAREAKKA